MLSELPSIEVVRFYSFKWLSLKQVEYLISTKSWGEARDRYILGTFSPNSLYYCTDMDIFNLLWKNLTAQNQEQLLDGCVTRFWCSQSKGSKFFIHLVNHAKTPQIIMKVLCQQVVHKGDTQATKVVDDFLDNCHENGIYKINIASIIEIFLQSNSEFIHRVVERNNTYLLSEILKRLPTIEKKRELLSSVSNVHLETPYELATYVKRSNICQLMLQHSNHYPPMKLLQNSAMIEVSSFYNF